MCKANSKENQAVYQLTWGVRPGTPSIVVLFDGYGEKGLQSNMAG